MPRPPWAHRSTEVGGPFRPVTRRPVLRRSSFKRSGSYGETSTSRRLRPKASPRSRPSRATVVKSDPRCSAGPEPGPDSGEVRARWDRAEEVTNQMVASYFDVLSGTERQELTEALQASPG